MRIIASSRLGVAAVTVATFLSSCIISSNANDCPKGMPAQGDACTHESTSCLYVQQGESCQRMVFTCTQAAWSAPATFACTQQEGAANVVAANAAAASGAGVGGAFGSSTAVSAAHVAASAAATSSNAATSAAAGSTGAFSVGAAGGVMF